MENGNAAAFEPVFVAIKQEPLETEHLEAYSNVYNVKVEVVKHEVPAAATAGDCDTQIKPHSNTKHIHKCFSCDYCDYRTAYNSALETHIRTHTGEKPFSCNRAGCNYKTSNDSNLRSHLKRAHTGEKPHFCPQCDYKCLYAHRLKTHMMTHTGEKPYTCERCNYKCSQACSLKRHIKYHCGKKPKHGNYKCSTTSMTTRNKSKHKQTEPGTTPEFVVVKMEHADPAEFIPVQEKVSNMDKVTKLNITHKVACKMEYADPAEFIPVQEKLSNMDKVRKPDVTHKVACKMEHENAAESMPVRETPFKQELLDPDYPETCVNVYDMKFEVVKHEEEFITGD